MLAIYCLARVRESEESALMKAISNLGIGRIGARATGRADGDCVVDLFVILRDLSKNALNHSDC